MGAAKPLYKVDRLHGCAGKIRLLEKQLAAEQQLRTAAERNAARFHALMLQARINLLAAQKERTLP